MIIKLILYRCILLENEASDFIETLYIGSYILTHCGSKAVGLAIEG